MAGRDGEPTNIGPRGRQRRLLLGGVMLLAGFGALAGLITLGAPLWTRLALFLPFWVGALGYFQARTGTCVAHAARGTRDMDSGREAITDPAELALVRARARRIQIQALVVAAVLTGMTFLTPD